VRAAKRGSHRRARRQVATTQFVAVGRKSAQYLARSRRKLVGEFTYHDTPTFGEAQAISKFICDLFVKGEVDAVEVVYTRFINTLSQRPDRLNLLPFVPPDSQDRPAQAPGAQPSSETPDYDFLFEPNAETVMERLVLYLVDFAVAQLLLEAKASEHSARMVAMKNATDNAKQLVKELTLEYNKMRQASITKELLEISSAAMALG